MKKLFLPIAMVVMTLSACAQTSSLDRFYNKFKTASEGEANFTINPSFMLQACFSGKDKDNDKSEAGTWLKKVTEVRLLILDQKKAPTAREWSDLAGSLVEDHFEELFSVRKGKDRVQLMSADRKDGLKELVFLAAGEDGGGIFLHFKGHFTAADLEKMQSALHDNQSKKAQ